MSDVFRPRHQPALTLYEAFQNEAKKRKGRSVTEWVTAERMAVWKAARDYAQAYGLAVPTLIQVEAAERYAMGSADYGAKWAYQVERTMKDSPAPTKSEVK